MVIPVHNRPHEITECLESLQKLDYPPEKLEIIVVDDASTDHTAAAAAGFPVRLIRLAQNRGASYCRNRGALAARSEILAFIDSDCLAGAFWLRDLTPAFAGPAVGIVGGAVEGHFERSGLDRYEQAKSSLRVARRYTVSKPAGDSFYVPSCNLLVKRSAFLQVKGFNQDLHVGEDVDLCWRVQDLGLRVVFQPGGEVFHKHRSRIKDFCRRRFQYGTSEPLLQKLHQKRKKRFPVSLTALAFWAGWLIPALGGPIWPAARVNGRIYPGSFAGIADGQTRRAAGGAGGGGPARCCAPMGPSCCTWPPSYRAITWRWASCWRRLRRRFARGLWAAIWPRRPGSIWPRGPS